VTDVFTLAVILYFIVLFKSFILLIKHYFVDQRAIMELEEKQSKMDKGYFNVRSNRRMSKIRFENVLYIESLADYIVIHLENGQKVQSKEKISHIEKELPDSFLRVHRSFIVNRVKISTFNREEVLLGDIELPIGRTYKTQVSNVLK
jgi:DNA-binding LytR/AlgR family response regulator